MNPFLADTLCASERSVSNVSAPTDSTSTRKLANAIVPKMLTAHQTPAICRPSNARRTIKSNSSQVCIRARATSFVRPANQVCTIARLDSFSISKLLGAHRRVAACWNTSQNVQRMVHFCHTFTIAVTTTSAMMKSHCLDRAHQDCCSILHRDNVIWMLWLLVLLHHVQPNRYGPTRNPPKNWLSEHEKFWLNLLPPRHTAHITTQTINNNGQFQTKN